MSIGARVICWKDACSWLHHKQITAIQKAESALPCSKRLIHSYLSLTRTLSPFPGMRYPSLRYDETQTCLVYLYILCRARGDVEACSTWPGPNTQAHPERSTLLAHYLGLLRLWLWWMDLWIQSTQIGGRWCLLQENTGALSEPNASFRPWLIGPRRPVLPDLILSLLKKRKTARQRVS